jgi:predicted helicase
MLLETVKRGKSSLQRRKNCRTGSELRQKESGNVFGLGSRTTVTITILVKKGIGNENIS